MKEENFPNTWLGNPAHCHLTGIFSPSYLSQGRISPEIPGLYTEIIYNPLHRQRKRQQNMGRLCN